MKLEKNKEGLDISDKEILEHLEEIVKSGDIKTLTAKKVMEKLEESLKIPRKSLSYKKMEINKMLEDLVSKGYNEDINVGSDTESDVYEPHYNNFVSSNTEPDNEDHLNKTKNDKISTKRKQESMMSINEFLEKAKVINLKVDNSDIILSIKPRKFSTGSVGWYLGGKIPLPIGDDAEVICQVSINCTVVGSKSWSEEPEKKIKKSF